MQLIKPMALGITSRCIEFRRRIGLVITGSLYFPFRAQGEAAVWTESSMWKFLAAEMPEGPFIDECNLKPRSEYLLRAHAFAPEGRAKAVEVVARVAGKEKKLHAVGPRRWLDGQASAPDFFESLPLDWQHTYGGADWPHNPLGMGRRPLREPGAPAPEHFLPQVVVPGANPADPDDSVPAACFRPIDCAWPQRVRHAGTYDEQWLKQQSPGFASDIDWRYFNMAQEDQWFDAPPRGDEDFEFVNMHPSKAQVGGVLPGLRVRCFADHGDGQTPKLREVALKLATLWFFPHHEVGIALFQGLAECNEDDASDIHTLLGAIEHLSETKPTQHYLDALTRRRHPKDGALHALRESDLKPAGLSSADPNFDAVQKDFAPDGLFAQAQRRGAVLKMQLAIDDVKAKGIDPAKLGLTIPQAEVAPTLENLPDYLFKKRAELLNAQVSAALDAAEQMAAAKLKAKAFGIDPESLVHRGPPTYRAAAHMAELQTLAKAAPGAPPALDVAKIGPKLTQLEAMARTSYLATAHTQAPARPMPPARAKVLRDAVAKAHAEGKSFFAADLTGADLSGLDLAGADFTNAWLEGANLAGAQLQRTSFAYAVLAHADLTAADFSEADLSGANLGRANLKTTRLVKANLTGANCSDTELAQTDLRGARIDGLKLHGASFGLADWRSVHGAGLLFHKAVLKDMVLNRCTLQQPVFIECDLSGVDFAAAQLERPTFIKCRGQGIRFARAVLPGSVFVDGCDFSGADFAEAQLRGSNLRGTLLAQAKFRQALLDDCDLSDADCSGADFGGASLRGALLIKTRFGQAALPGANLMNAIAQRADLRGADLAQANLYGSDLSRVHADSSSRLQGANLERTRLHPMREPKATA
ncbi:DUF2169 domain-containing protein [Aquincola sp. S2]|uniref:DUF2169 domain-containing protein n=1 Tax=Pseudaquabacterium terrae TaxID=2732868 RepID=A0ABX2EBE8_9BURK|nr:DUF2169 domain-containing protein [Aquabacterium terrae]NRF66456.1 DUF2169 domain-containing protein [Aquabacterium terrae]